MKKPDDQEGSRKMKGSGRFQAPDEGIRMTEQVALNRERPDKAKSQLGADAEQKLVLRQGIIRRFAPHPSGAASLCLAAFPAPALQTPVERAVLTESSPDNKKAPAFRRRPFLFIAESQSASRRIYKRQHETNLYDIFSIYFR